MTAMIFGEIYRYNGEWKFGAIGQEQGTAASVRWQQDFRNKSVPV